MNFHVGTEMAFLAGLGGLAWGVLITVIWILIALRAVKAHERLAKAAEELASRR